MNYWLRKLIPGFLLVSLLGGSAWAQGRIGTVDLGKVFDGYWKTKQAQSILKDRQTDMEKELKNMVDDQKKAKEAYDKLVNDANDAAISGEEKDKRKKAAEEKLRYLKDQEETINQYGRQARVTLDEQGKRMRESIIGEIRNVVSAKSKSAGYSLVIDTAAESFNKTPIIIYSNNDNDITDDVLKQLNATAPTDLGAGSGEKKMENLSNPADDKKGTEKKK
jgi:Skp family chaperone for outer membrane proteins